IQGQFYNGRYLVTLKHQGFNRLISQAGRILLGTGRFGGDGMIIIFAVTFTGGFAALFTSVGIFGSVPGHRSSAATSTDLLIKIAITVTLFGGLTADPPGSDMIIGFTFALARAIIQ